MPREGPTVEVRELAVQVRRRARVRKIEALIAQVKQLAQDIAAGRLQRQSVMHKHIYEAVGISRAAYWRYVKTVAEVRDAVDVLLKPSANQRTPAQTGEAEEKQVAGEARGEALDKVNLEGQIAKLQSVLIHLERQVAVCQIWIRNLEMHLTAKEQELSSKSALLSMAYEREQLLSAKIGQLAELLRANGVEVTLDVSVTGVRQDRRPGKSSRSAPQPKSKRKSVHLRLIEPTKNSGGSESADS